MVALGQALLQSGSKDEARRAFRRALQLEPGRADAKAGEAATQSDAARVDFTLLGGITRFGNDGTANNSTQTGVRFAEFAVEPEQKVRLWFQYDNSLGLDNFSLAQSDQHVPTYYVGGLVNYRRNFITRLEFG